MQEGVKGGSWNNEEQYIPFTDPAACWSWASWTELLRPSCSTFPVSPLIPTRLGLPAQVGPLQQAHTEARIASWHIPRPPRPPPKKKEKKKVPHKQEKNSQNKGQLQNFVFSPCYLRLIIKIRTNHNPWHLWPKCGPSFWQHRDRGDKICRLCLLALVLTPVYRRVWPKSDSPSQSSSAEVCPGESWQDVTSGQIVDKEALIPCCFQWEVRS